jgi:hypothetical protein
MSDGFKRYLVCYRHDGGDWNIEIPARSVDDARQRLSKLALGRLEGEIVAKIPSALSPFAAAAAFLRNAMIR